MVYVGKNEYKLGRMKMSHMIADSLEELHEMAQQLGMKRKWFQDKPKKPHYDITKTNKKLAIEKFGAKLVSDKEIIIILKEKYG